MAGLLPALSSRADGRWVHQTQYLQRVDNSTIKAFLQRSQSTNKIVGWEKDKLHPSLRDGH